MPPSDKSLGYFHVPLRGNPAENHPVGFRFVFEAKCLRKVKLVCIDPRFNPTAAVSDCYVPIRSGTDIAFLGGLIHYALGHGKYHADYIRLHMNASLLVKEGMTFQEGLFSGWDGQKCDKSSWDYQRDERNDAKVDPSLEDPRCVFQILKTNYKRYTPEVVASIFSCSVEDFRRAAEIICSTGRPDERGTMLDALGWTQHSHSVQLIHTAPMLQLLLGNIGVPGGGDGCRRCGHKPQAAVLRAEDHTHVLSLACCLFLSEWTVPRGVCPACGQEGKDSLVYYNAEGFGHITVQACERCKVYLHTIDLAKDGAAVDEVDELAALPLDLWAREQGYRKLQVNMAGCTR